MMKKTFCFLLLASVCCAAFANASVHLLEDVWEKYATTAVSGMPEAPAPSTILRSAPVRSVPSESSASADTPAALAQNGTPGRVLGQAQGEGDAAFAFPWKYRSRTYELHYEDPTLLARSVYGLALHAGDVSQDLPRETFIHGVLGYHYSLTQICAWLNAVVSRRQALAAEEKTWVDMLLADSVLTMTGDSYAPTGTVVHVLAAAPGKKRTFAANLLHERLHVFWDEDVAFRRREHARWQGMGEKERTKAREELKNYAQDNEAQLIEEWAVRGAESFHMSLE